MAKLIFQAGLSLPYVSEQGRYKLGDSLVAELAERGNDLSGSQIP